MGRLDCWIARTERPSGDYFELLDDERLYRTRQGAEATGLSPFHVEGIDPEIVNWQAPAELWSEWRGVPYRKRTRLWARMAED